MTTREPGISVLWRLTLGYAAMALASGTAILCVTYLFLLRYVPERINGTQFIPSRGDLVRAFAPPATWTMLGLLVGSLVFGWLLARWMLRPVDEIQRATSAVTDGALSHRIAMRGRADEFRQLADAFDTMLDRVEHRLDEQRRFAANASHELRTPLAVTRSLIEVARAEPDLDVSTLLDRLELVNDRAIASTESLLLLSRVDANLVPTDIVDLSIAADEAVESLHPVLARTTVGLQLDLGEAALRGDETLITRLVANLVHNAIVHNVQDSGFVRVRTWTAAGCAELEVENSGPMMRTDDARSLTEPFQRRGRVHTEGRARTAADDPLHAGVGLGLAIVASIVRAHGGTLTLTARAEGGLMVRARFVAAPTANTAPAPTRDA